MNSNAYSRKPILAQADDRASLAQANPRASLAQADPRRRAYCMTGSTFLMIRAPPGFPVKNHVHKRITNQTRSNDAWTSCVLLLNSNAYSRKQTLAQADDRASLAQANPRASLAQTDPRRRAYCMTGSTFLMTRAPPGLPVKNHVHKRITNQTRSNDAWMSLENKLEPLTSEINM